MGKKRKANYAIGYGKPPVHTKFKKGRSGNPKGRPKRSPESLASLESQFIAALNSRVMITDGEGTRHATKYETAMMQLVNKAAAGDIRHLKVVLEILQFLGATSERVPTTTPRADSSARQRIMAKLERMHERIQARVAKEVATEAKPGNAGGNGFA